MGHPVHAFVQTITSLCIGGLNVPFDIISELGESKFICQFWNSQSSWKILLVGVDEDGCILQVFISSESVESFSGLSDAITICTVNDEDETLRVVEVVLPECSQSVLTTDIPAVELEILVGELLNIEANCWNCLNCFVELQLVEDCGLACGVETEHQHLDWCLLIEAVVDVCE